MQGGNALSTSARGRTGTQQPGALHYTANLLPSSGELGDSVSDQQSSAPSWAPDAKTLIWAFGRAHESGVEEAIRESVNRRGHDLDRDSDAYWRLVAATRLRLSLMPTSNVPTAGCREDVVLRIPRGPWRGP